MGTWSLPLIARETNSILKPFFSFIPIQGNEQAIPQPGQSAPPDFINGMRKGTPCKYLVKHMATNLMVFFIFSLKHKYNKVTLNVNSLNLL